LSDVRLGIFPDHFNDPTNVILHQTFVFVLFFFFVLSFCFFFVSFLFLSCHSRPIHPSALVLYRLAKDPVVTATCKAALAALQARGATVVEVALPNLQGLALAHAMTIAAEFA
jgi:hypothetical protein